MRRFNLKGTVVERMKGIQRQEPKPAETAASKTEEKDARSQPVQNECANL